MLRTESSRSRFLAVGFGACLLVAGCATTYTQAELDAAEPLAEKVEVPNCTGLDDEPGCEWENPVCIDPSDYRCLPPGG